MLKSLESNGLISKQQDKTDKRMVKVFLTEKGREKREIAREVVKKFNKVVQSAIPEDKLSVFFEVIEKISEIAEN